MAADKKAAKGGSRMNRFNNCLQQLSKSSSLAAVRAAVFTLLLYCLFSAIFFTNVEGWTTWEAIYFSMVTMSTVGYGDLYPTFGYSRLVGVVFILVGIIVVFVQIGGVVGLFLKPLFDATRDIMDWLWEPSYVQINDESGIGRIEAPRRPLIFYFKGLIGPILILLGFQMFSAALFIWVEPEWDLETALWYVMVTATTVGYGDVSVSRSNEWGLFWASLHILLSVSLLAALIEDVQQLKQHRKELLTQVFQFKKCHEEETLRDLDEDGSGELNEVEFVLGMLVKIGKLDREKDVEPIKMMFDGIDKNHDGKVNLNRLETHQEAMKKKLRELDDYVQRELQIMEVREADLRESQGGHRVSPAPPLPPPVGPPPGETPRGDAARGARDVPRPPPYPPPQVPGHTTWYVTW